MQIEWGFSLPLEAQEQFNATGVTTVTITKRELTIAVSKLESDFHVKVKAGKSVVDANGRKRPAWNDPSCTATIVSLNLEHSGGCIRCPQQHVMTKSRAGKYVGDISTMALFTLCNTASRAGRELDSVVSGK